MNQDTQKVLRAAIQQATVAQMRAEKITRPEIPAVKRSGRYCFVAVEVSK